LNVVVDKSQNDQHFVRFWLATSLPVWWHYGKLFNGLD